MLNLKKRISLLLFVGALCQGLFTSHIFALQENSELKYSKESELFHCDQLHSFEKESMNSTNTSERMNPNRICILIHGYHLQAEEWDNIIFGTKENPGRVPVGIEEAINKRASLIFWGTGGSEKDGIIESNYIFSKALGPKLNDLAEYVKKDPEELVEYLKSISFLDRRALNTMEEVTFAIEECVANNIQELILVSSPTHIARCLQEACKVKEQDRTLKLKIYARASETCFANSTAKDVTIFEPPHRGDSHKVPIHQTVKGIFQFLKDPKSAADFNQALVQFIEAYKHS